MTEDRGQALVVAVLALAFAATAIVGLSAAQDRILADTRDRRAGEAAVEAAGASLADALVGHTRAPDAVAGDPLVVERARAAADRLSATNGGAPVRELSVDAVGGGLEVTLRMGRHLHRAAVGATCCRP